MSFMAFLATCGFLAVLFVAAICILAVAALVVFRLSEWVFDLFGGR